MVAKPYVVLTAAQCSIALSPHNSVRRGAVLNRGCNTHPNPHPTPNVGAIPDNLAPAGQNSHARASYYLGLYCSYVSNKLNAVQHHNLHKHWPPAHKTS